MKKRKLFTLYFLTATFMLSSVYSCKDNDEMGITKETGQLKFELKFEGTSGAATSRAAASTAIPVTSWNNIKQVQFFLYDANGIVKYSVTETPSSSKTYTYVDVPTGSYTLVAVANAKSSSDAIVTQVPSLNAVEWNNFNVRTKAVSGLTIAHKPATFPTYASPANNTAYAAPSEIFMAEATGITITSGSTFTAPTLTLKREVSLMRLRINVADTDAGVNNSTGDKGVDWTKNASVLVYRLPEKIGIEAGNKGGVTATSKTADIMVAATAFETANPAAGYSPSNILGGKFTMWKDIVVFPNNGGRANDGKFADNADVSRQYFVVLSAMGKSGHMLADGTKLQADATVYWSGLVKGNFERNYIREVNLTLKSGGSTVIPTSPIEQGSLIIGLSEPAPWNTNIQEESIIM